MKKFAPLFLLSLITVNVFSQKKGEEKSGFDMNKVFVGGSIALGYGVSNSSYYSSYNNDNYGSNFIIGANPEIGYSVGEWLDAGLVFNAIYQNTKYYDDYGSKIKQNTFNYGVGIFAKLYVTKAIYLQLQPEHNWRSYKASYVDLPSSQIKGVLQATSLLGGLGYCQRMVGESNFYTVVMLDFNTEINSPYRYYGKMVPVIRTGFSWYLNSKKKR